jgi:hypothetical protein
MSTRLVTRVRRPDDGNVDDDVEDDDNVEDNDDVDDDDDECSQRSPEES